MADTKNVDPAVRELGSPVGFEDVVLSGGVGVQHIFVAPIRAIHVGGAGIVIASVDGVNYHSFTCVASTYLRGAFKRVKSTADGTTASLLVGCM